MTDAEAIRREWEAQNRLNLGSPLTLRQRAALKKFGA